MASGPFNISKGRAIEFFNRVANNDPANSAIVVVLLQAAEADATLEDYADLASLLAAAGNIEADFTNYARKILTDADITAPSPDNTNNLQAATIPSQTWTLAGGTVDNSIVQAVLCYDPDTTAGTDSDLVVISHHDFAVTTSGVDLVMNPSASGAYSAS